MLSSSWGKDKKPFEDEHLKPTQTYNMKSLEIVKRSVLLVVLLHRSSRDIFNFSNFTLGPVPHSTDPPGQNKLFVQHLTSDTLAF